MTVPLLEVFDLNISLVECGRLKTLVNHFDLTIQPGEMVGLVGESGSGKSLTVSAMMGLLPRHLQVSGGQIRFRGKDLSKIGNDERRSLRGKEMALVFQDYQGSLTPFIPIGKQMVEMICCHEKYKTKEAGELALAVLDKVQLPAQRVFESYSFQLSGGQQQRVAFAMAMLLRPALFIADEPTTALDTVTQHHILDLLTKLQQETKCSVLLISHDLTQVLNRTDRVVVMYGGQKVEEGPTRIIERNAKHPYTQLLLEARPSLSDKPHRLRTIPGEPGLINDRGCPFSLRCPLREDECINQPMKSWLGHQHEVYCHLIKHNETEVFVS